MAKAFSIARALDQDHTKIVEGHLDADDWIGSTIIDPHTLNFNTGFKDKTGKEIFEGDIVHFGSHIGVVRFNNVHGAFTLTIPFGSYAAKFTRIIDKALSISLEERNNE